MTLADLQVRTQTPGIATAVLSADGNITTESVGVTRNDALGSGYRTQLFLKQLH